MMSTTNRNPDAPITRAAVMSRDHDIQKGAVEDGYPNITTNAPGLDADGLPDDEMGIGGICPRRARRRGAGII